MKKSVAVLAAAVLAGTMGAALAGPAGAKGTTPTTVPKVTKCVTKTATAGITQAMTLVLAGDPTTAMKYVDQGAKLAASYNLSNQVDTQSGINNPAQLHLPTSIKVTCKGSTKANFTYDLFVKDKTTATTGPPLGLSFGGDALIKKGVWYISGTTVCDLAGQAIGAVSDPTLKAQITAAVTACYTAIGQTAPPVS
jgi:hypothetical protein